MTSTPDKHTVTAAYMGCAAAATYASLKIAWALGSTFGVTDPVLFEEFLQSIGGPLVALWATVALALMAAAILLSFVKPWGSRVPQPLRPALPWMGAIMAPLGLVGLGQTIVGVIAGHPFEMLAPAIYIAVYACFTVIGSAFAVVAWRTRASTVTRAATAQPVAS